MVKCKDIELYPQQYISINHEEYIIHLWENNEAENEESSPTTWGTDW